MHHFRVKDTSRVISGVHFDVRPSVLRGTVTFLCITLRSDARRINHSVPCTSKTPYLDAGEHSFLPGLFPKHPTNSLFLASLLNYQGGLNSASVSLKNDRFQVPTDLRPQSVEETHCNQVSPGDVLDVRGVSAYTGSCPVKLKCGCMRPVDPC